MQLEQRMFLEETIALLRSGRLTRRAFLERTLSIGLASSTASTLLDACSAANPTPVTENTVISWESEHEFTNLYAQLVDTFNKNNKDGIYVLYSNGLIDTGSLHDTFASMLQARSGQIDVMSMDIVWPPEFGMNKWTKPLDDMWPQKERDKYRPGPIEACTFDGHVWAAPHHMDVGLLFYRSDLIPTAPPKTWDELTHLAASAQSPQIPYGYLWQGALYEGLVCNFVEVLYGHGGAILDPTNPKRVIVHSPEAEQALTKMVASVNTISTPQVTTFKEEETHLLWQNGLAAFVRYWPGLYSLSNDSSVSKIVGKFAATAIPYGGSNTVGHSCIGGWQLGINAFSKNQDAAWEFIKYLIGLEAQKDIVRNASLIATLKDVYNDPTIQRLKIFPSDFEAILNNAKSRPASPQYIKISNTIQTHIHGGLKGQDNVKNTLDALQVDLQSIVDKG